MSKVYHTVIGFTNHFRQKERLSFIIQKVKSLRCVL